MRWPTPATGWPIRVDGYTVGVADLTENPPHRGELHPDGDELLYLVSGRVDVIVEEGGTEEAVGTERRHALTGGQAFVVPRGAWHRVDVVEPCRLVYVTPGPGDGHRLPRPHLLAAHQRPRRAGAARARRRGDGGQLGVNSGGGLHRHRRRTKGPACS